MDLQELVVVGLGERQEVQAGDQHLVAGDLIQVGVGEVEGLHPDLEVVFLGEEEGEEVEEEVEEAEGDVI